jgi:hypothetical protein
MRGDISSGLFLVACEEYTPVVPKRSSKKKKPKYRFDLYLIRPGFVRGLHVDLMRTGIDFIGGSERALFPIRPGAAAALVDFGARKLVPLEGDLQVLSASEKHALLRRGNGLTLWTSQGEEPLPGEFSSLAPVVSSGAAVAVERTMYHLGDELRTWELPAAPLWLTPQGYALIPKKSAIEKRWAEGPLLLLAPPDGQGEKQGAGKEADPASAE